MEEFAFCKDCPGIVVYGSGTNGHPPLGRKYGEVRGSVDLKDFETLLGSLGKKRPKQLPKNRSSGVHPRANPKNKSVGKTLSEVVKAGDDIMTPGGWIPVPAPPSSTSPTKSAREYVGLVPRIIKTETGTTPHPTEEIKREMYRKEHVIMTLFI